VLVLDGAIGDRWRVSGSCRVKGICDLEFAVSHDLAVDVYVY
jgi:hypothetical protein